MKQEEPIEIKLPNWEDITGMFQKRKKQKEKQPEENITLQKYTLTPEEIKKDYNIKGNIEKIEIQHGTINIYTKQKN